MTKMNFSDALTLLNQKRSIKRQCWDRQKVMLDNGEFYYITPSSIDKLYEIPARWLLATDWVTTDKIERL